MLKFSANLSMMFTEHPFLDRFAAASAAGFQAVEFLFPYAFTPDEIGRKISDNQLGVSVFNLYCGDWDLGNRGYAAVPDHKEAFNRSVHQAIPFAAAAGARRLHVMAGIATPGPETNDTYVANIQKAADTFALHGLEVLIEPINHQDMPGYFLSSTEQALGLLEQINRPNVGLQFDIYHQQITGGEVIPTLKTCLPYIRHIQIASVPDRHEPDVGNLLYRPIFDALEQAAYTGWVGCEYHPKGNTLQGLSWLQSLGQGDALMSNPE